MAKNRLIFSDEGTKVTIHYGNETSSLLSTKVEAFEELEGLAKKEKISSEACTTLCDRIVEADKLPVGQKKQPNA